MKNYSFEIKETFESAFQKDPMMLQDIPLEFRTAEMYLNVLNHEDQRVRDSVFLGDEDNSIGALNSFRSSNIFKKVEESAAKKFIEEHKGERGEKKYPEHQELKKAVDAEVEGERFEIITLAVKNNPMMIRQTREDQWQKLINICEIPDIIPQAVMMTPNFVKQISVEYINDTKLLFDLAVKLFDKVYKLQTPVQTLEEKKLQTSLNREVNNLTEAIKKIFENEGVGINVANFDGGHNAFDHVSVAKNIADINVANFDGGHDAFDFRPIVKNVGDLYNLFESKGAIHSASY
jgi:hypothetical protein